MRSALLALGFLFFVILVALVYKLPAKFVYQQLPSSSIQLGDISGSIWSGHVDAIHTPELIINDLDWQLSFWSLLVGDINLQWTVNDPSVMLQGQLNISGENIRLMNLEGQLDLVGLAERMTEQSILFGGNVDIDIAMLQIEDENFIDAVGGAKWVPAQLLAPENIELGEFKADLSTDSERLIVELKDTGGATMLDGEFKISPKGRYDYYLRIIIRDTSVPGLLDGFYQLPQQGDGSALLSGHGNLF